MKNEIKLEPQLTQKLSLRQKIGLNLLVKNELQLRQYLHQEMEVNPFLELEIEQEEDKIDEEIEEINDNLDLYDSSKQKSGMKGKGNSYIIENYTGPSNWKKNLSEEISLSKFSKKEKEILEDILYNINEEGFLEDEKAIIEEHNISKEDFESYLEDFLFLSDGIGARNLEESFKWQLKSKGIENKKLLNIVTKYTEDIKEQRIDKVLMKEKISENKYEYYKSLLKSLSNKPGYALEEENIEYIQPDVFIEKTKEGDFYIKVGKKYNTYFSANQKYLNIMKKKNTKSKLKNSEKKFLKKYYQRYKYIKQSLESRRETLKKLAKYLLEYQKNFFEKGPKYLKPLTRTKVAEDLDYHPSTIARTVQNKYVQTDFGIFPMAMFFPKSANEKSRILIYIKMKNIIENEDKNNPYTDSKIAEKLQENGIDIKRRTVSKYRKKIGIPSRRERKI